MLSFEEVVQAHHKAVYGFALRMLKDATAAEDALQETFIAAMKAYPSFRGEASVKTWLFSIARNTVHRQQRRRVGEPSTFEPLTALGQEAGWGSLDTPESLLMRAEDQATLHRALDALPPDSREILLLRDVEGFTGPEAAKMIGLELRAAKSRLHRARLRLIAALKAEVSP